MQYLTVALPLAALVSGTFANPFVARGWDSAPKCSDDACLAAVTGKAALGDGALRSSHCASFLATTVTPPAVTETVTITGIEDKKGWKRGVSVTVCPNEVPNYASACDEAHYTSACACFGFTEIKTTTVKPTTTTKTVYVLPTLSCGTSGGVITKTVTVSGSYATATTVTVTKGGATASCPAVATTTSAAPSKCKVNDAKATELVNNFITLLEFTSYPGGAQGAPGRGYKLDVSNATLDVNFVDISDSINFMAGIPLGSVTFPSKAAFDYGQGTQQPEVDVTTLNIFHDCNSITWRWLLKPAIPGAYPVTGINYMIVGDNGKLIKNYAEFDNGAWLQSFGRQCAINNVSVSPSGPALKRDAGLLKLHQHY